MTLAFMLISTADNKPFKELFENLEQSLKSIKYATVDYVYPLCGEWNAIAKIEAEDYTKLGNYILAVREKPGIVDTKTLPVVRF